MSTALPRPTAVYRALAGGRERAGQVGATAGGDDRQALGAGLPVSGSPLREDGLEAEVAGERWAGGHS